MNLWISNTDGKKDAVLTLTVIGFAVVLVKVLLGGNVYEFASNKISVGSIDGSAIAAILSPTLGAYVARRYTDKKHVAKKESQDGNP